MGVIYWGRLGRWRSIFASAAYAGAWSGDTLYYELMDEALPAWLATLSAAYRPWSARTP
jgi:hypothetical protein